MDEAVPMEPTLLERLFVRGAPVFWARWVFLRGLGGIFFSVFYSLAYQIHGLIGPHGILPARDYLGALSAQLGPVQRVWLAPTFLWLGAGDEAMTAIVVVGMLASILLVLNVWPRGTVAIAGLAFLSFIAAAQEFASYQSDGMLLEAAFASLFFAPRGWRPGLGEASPPSRASLFVLRWEWFRIYFESGLVKLASHDPQWATLTAMDHYYERGPLPTWAGWYVQQRMPHGFHAFSCVLMFAVELGVVLLAGLGKKARRICFAIVTPFQVGIILTANYAFLNYIVLLLGVLLLDDDVFVRLGLRPPAQLPVKVARWRVHGAAFAIGWVLYVTVFSELRVPPDTPLGWPVLLVEPTRIANSYGLFAVMTEARYELEFQATTDGATWIPYRYRYKPQDVMEAPGIYAPYQPRFEWNLWFASLGWGRGQEWVVDAELRLMQGEKAVLGLFREDPLHGALPKEVRIVQYEYWFTTAEEKRATGAWWKRKEMGVYAPVLERRPDGTVGIEGM